MGRIIHLDLSKKVLIGWEEEKSDKVIEAIVRGIEAEDDFPAVPVHEENGIYYLSPLRENPDGLCDAGHYRAVGHFIANKPLKCELLNGGPPIPNEIEIPISRIILVDDTGQYEEHKRRFPNYR